MTRICHSAAKKAPIINIFYKFRGLPFEIKSSINDQVGSITMNQAFTNLLNPMIVGSRVTEIVQYYISCNNNVHSDPNNSPVKCEHDVKTVVKAANLTFCKLCAFSTFTNTFLQHNGVRPLPLNRNLHVRTEFRNGAALSTIY
jgi:hypothetical protein